MECGNHFVAKTIFYLFFAYTGDDAEKLYEERHHASHRKFVDTVRKIYTRLQAEETKYKERLAELEVRGHSKS